MGALSRRTLLQGSACAAVAAVIPSAVISEAVASAPVAVTPPTPMWAVGTPGEWDWMPIAAPDAEMARRIWVSERIGGMQCEEVENEQPSNPDCDCEWCHEFGGADAERQVEWDGKIVPPGGDLWMAAGLGANCSRCGYETFLEEGGNVVGDKAVCEGCMTLADWDIVDPKRAAELRDDDTTPARNTKPAGDAR